jgi:hypothetical protein
VASRARRAGAMTTESRDQRRLRNSLCRELWSLPKESKFSCRMSRMRRTLLPVLAVALLGTSGCVAAIIGAAGAGAGFGYTQTKKSHTPVKQHDPTQPAKGTPRPKGVKLLPAPGEFVDCKLKDGEKLAMSAGDCRAKGGTTS